MLPVAEAERCWLKIFRLLVLLLEAVEDMDEDSVDEVDDELRTRLSEARLDCLKVFGMQLDTLFRLCCCVLTGRSRTRSGRLTSIVFMPDLLLVREGLDSFRCLRILSSSSELWLRFSLKSLLTRLFSRLLAFLSALDEVDELVDELELVEDVLEEDSDETRLVMSLLLRAELGLTMTGLVVCDDAVECSCCCCWFCRLGVLTADWLALLVLKSSCFMSSRTEASASSMWCILSWCLLLRRLSKLISCWLMLLRGELVLLVWI